MTGNYQLVYYDAENVGIIGILAYPKIKATLHVMHLKNNPKKNQVHPLKVCLLINEFSTYVILMATNELTESKGQTTIKSDSYLQIRSLNLKLILSVEKNLLGKID